MGASSTTRRLRPYGEMLGNFLINLVAFRMGRRTFRPLLTNFYVTKRCNLRCRYCYPPGDEPELTTADALLLLEKIRPHNPALNLTGGEPLLHSGLPALIRRARELGFYPLLLSTNGLLIDRIDDCLSLVDHLIISLDSVDEHVGDTLAGVSGVTREVIAIIQRCATLSREEGFSLSVHAVIAPETGPGIEDLVRFCAELGATLSVSPEHGRFLPHPALVGNSVYTTAVDRLIALKRAGWPVAASLGYLRGIRDFSPHGCHPHLSPRVEPDGRVYFPCQRLRTRHAFLQDYGSLCQMMQNEAVWERVATECRTRCFLACYLEVDRYLGNPLSLLSEGLMRRWVMTGARSAVTPRGVRRGSS